MAGGAEKKAAVRARRAWLLYGGLVALVNAVFFGVRLGVYRQPLSRREWTLTLFLAGCYALALLNLASAAAVDVTPEAAIDLLGLAVLVQLASLYSARAWYLLALIPAYFLYSFAGPLAGLVGGWGGARLPGGEAPGDAAAAAAAKASEAAMDAKRQRRAEHAAKRRVAVR